MFLPSFIQFFSFFSVLFQPPLHFYCFPRLTHLIYPILVSFLLSILSSVYNFFFLSTLFSFSFFICFTIHWLTFQQFIHYRIYFTFSLSSATLFTHHFLPSFLLFFYSSIFRIPSSLYLVSFHSPQPLFFFYNFLPSFLPYIYSSLFRIPSSLYLVQWSMYNDYNFFPMHMHPHLSPLLLFFSTGSGISNSL